MSENKTSGQQGALSDEEICIECNGSGEGVADTKCMSCEGQGGFTYNRSHEALQRMQTEGVPVVLLPMAIGNFTPRGVTLTVTSKVIINEDGSVDVFDQVAKRAKLSRAASPRAEAQAVPEDAWLRDFIAERRRLSFNLELHAHETANINLFLDELEKAWRAARA